MSAKHPDGESVTGPYGARAAVTDDVWYGVRLVEVMAHGEPGPRGGKGESVQLLLMPSEARDLAALLLTYAGSAESNLGEEADQ